MDSQTKVVGCQGIIKKLFPQKRYGFVVCECLEHSGEAHFNYSDLQLTDNEKASLCTGWRLKFNISEQGSPTMFCRYRATSVSPVDVMVVQCDVISFSSAYLTVSCRELGNKTLTISRDNYNGSWDKPNNRNDTCRAAVSWTQIKERRPEAEHGSQDTPLPVLPQNPSPSAAPAAPFRRDSPKTPRPRAFTHPLKYSTFNEPPEPCTSRTRRSSTMNSMGYESETSPISNTSFVSAANGVSMYPCEPSPYGNQKIVSDSAFVTDTPPLIHRRSHENLLNSARYVIRSPDSLINGASLDSSSPFRSLLSPSTVRLGQLNFGAYETQDSFNFSVNESSTPTRSRAPGGPVGTRRTLLEDRLKTNDQYAAAENESPIWSSRLQPLREDPSL